MSSIKKENKQRNEKKRNAGGYRHKTRVSVQKCLYLLQ